jgi:hypothetical protein
MLTLHIRRLTGMCRIRASEREDRTPSGDAAALRQSLPLEFDAHFKEGSMGATLTVDSRKNAMVSTSNSHKYSSSTSCTMCIAYLHTLPLALSTLCVLM